MRSLISSQILQTLPMSNVGRPILLKQGSEEEIEVFTSSHIALYNEEQETELSDLTITLTTIRILIMSNERKQFHFIELKNVTSMEKRNKFFASPKIVLHLLSSTSHSHQHHQKPYIMFSFRKGSRDDFFSHLETQLKRKNWVAFDQMKKSLEERNKEASQKTTATNTFNASSAGLTGIINRVESQNKETEQKLSVAFSDLNSLMDKAREMVDLAEKFAEKLKKQNSSDQKEQEEIDDVLLNLGLSSVVTKKSAGNMFHQQLARQLAEFLPPHLQKHHGILALSDAFCLYNRARGTDLISPDDMFRACRLFAKLQLPMTLKKFDSGVIVIQSSDATDEKMAEKIAHLIEQNEGSGSGCVSAVDVAHSLKISVVLAQQQLLTAENLGILCRDESIEGVRFYLASVCFPI